MTMHITVHVVVHFINAIALISPNQVMTNDVQRSSINDK